MFRIGLKRKKAFRRRREEKEKRKP